MTTKSIAKWYDYTDNIIEKKGDAARQYVLKFLNKNHPSPSIIFKVVSQLRQMGGFRCLPKTKKIRV